MSRYFFAITPPVPMLDRLEHFRGRWGHPHHNVEPHVTVKVPFTWAPDPAPILEPVRAVCAQISPFAVRLGPPARFPGAQVLYLSVLAGGIKALHLAVSQALAKLIPLDKRGHEGERYTPHLTLAVGRFGIDAVGLDEMERAARAELADLSPFPVQALRCYRREREGDGWQVFIDLPLG